jgi:hypothetical protein
MTIRCQHMECLVWVQGFLNERLDLAAAQTLGYNMDEEINQARQA